MPGRETGSTFLLCWHSANTRENFCQMKRASGRVLRDLLAATEAIGDKDGFGGGLADGGQQNAFGESLRNVEFFALEAEGTGHTAAA